ncbi:MAG TPA: hypothetical protein VMM13_07320 [Euzebya sp.]|nr:hypothetical protein [Euzebya sp.]
MRKRLSAVMLAGLLALGVAACDDAGDTAVDPAAPAADPAADPALGDPALEPTDDMVEPTE